MNEKDKMIEEMAEEINNPERNWCDLTIRCKGCPHTGKSCKKYTCRDYAYADTLYNLGYRKIPEGSVVLSKEQNAKWSELFDQARKETAKEILQLAEKHNRGYETDMGNFLEDLKKQFGVEVEE